jgi:4-carboxymuconolactone decarboxylase
MRGQLLGNLVLITVAGISHAATGPLNKATADAGRTTTMNDTDNCYGGEALPSVREMSGNVPQRIPYPPGSNDDVGIYGALTNGQRISRYLPPKVTAGISAQSGALMRDGSLAPSLREMIIVRTGYRTASLYEVAQHRSLAERYGVTQSKLQALACIDPRGLDADEQAAIAFVDELLTRNRPRDNVLADVRRHFTDGQVIEMIFVTGNWWTLARMLETAGIPLDEDRIGTHGIQNSNSSK